MAEYSKHNASGESLARDHNPGKSERTGSWQRDSCKPMAMGKQQREQSSVAVTADNSGSL